MDTWIVTGLYVLAALLPTIGLGRTLLQAQIDARRNEKRLVVQAKEAGEGVDDAEAVVEDIRDPDMGWANDFSRAVHAESKSEAWINLLLIGVGLGFGAWASIWSLHL